MSTLRVNNVTDLGDDAVVTGGVLDALAVPAGGILQVVRATDNALSSTSSTSFVDVPGMSVTITPTATSSNVFVIASFYGSNNDPNSITSMDVQLTDSSDVALSGAEEMQLELYATGATETQITSPIVLIGFVSPASTSAQTYKLRFKRRSGEPLIRNNLSTGQMIAIEVAA